jgi:subtilisin family serine protease
MKINSSSINALSEKGDLALIAIIDTGIDIYHQAFLDEKGNTRIIAIWDQNACSSNEFGEEYGKDAINQKIECEEFTNKPNDDLLIHGTRVASIAAGSCIESDEEVLIGIAPESEIIVIIPNPQTGIKAGYPRILEYIQDLSIKHQKPVVVNISQGYNLGPHDGTSALEKKCDDFSDNGLVIVTSAGNERDKNSHAKLAFPLVRPAFIRWNSRKCLRKNDTIEVRFNSHNIMRFRLSNPNKQESSDWVSIYEAKPYHFSTGDSALLTYRALEEENGDATLTISIYTKNTSIQDGIWQLEIEEVKTHDKKDFLHAWIDNSGLSRERPIEFIENIDEKITLTMPGTARKVIAVGAVSSSTPSIVEPYSSFGPTRDASDGEQPFTVAIGNNVTAAMPNRSVIKPSTLFRVSNGGTSYAAPYITGAIALVLSAREKRRIQNNNIRQLNADDIKRFIINSATARNAEWNHEIGYGLLDLHTLLEEEANDALRLVTDQSQLSDGETRNPC